MIGIDPSPFTLGELRCMAREAERERWWRTATMLATAVNLRAGRAAVRAEDLHPIERAERREASATNDFSALRRLVE